MSNPIILDTFCGGGGAAVGYNRAGFDVVGIDIKPQKHYPFPFILGDALDILARMLQGEKFLAGDGRWYGIEDFDAIHASPPCQGYSVMNINAESYPRLIEEVRCLLKSIGRPYAIENVEGARREMKNFVMLCGTMFGLRVRRHRLFECDPMIAMSPMTCYHYLRVVKKGMKPDRNKHFAAIYGHFSDKEYGREAMDINWMSSDELSEAIPPAYTEYIGGYLLRAIEAQR